MTVNVISYSTPASSDGMVSAVMLVVNSSPSIVQVTARVGLAAIGTTSAFSPAARVSAPVAVPAGSTVPATISSVPVA